ncbi:DUF2971 domain-containing protein [Maritimibacter sp. DP1N21-5]|uniref:DUF2971 domain-containing protein n=1 Tax=Maritimibacter sp. DP1N21-5 TaxID=2836867 RepID=UPI001C482AD8|nr:DUF2971 domain-containing protein [Maritimibacter sp. DP1N21-5]MBV7408025.1 DUF2971 domain-containing protein [Maritimibacter sp. DP1N21-5]
MNLIDNNGLIPSTLCRYRPGDTEYALHEIEEALSRKQHWFSSVANANDPFDCNPAFTKSSNKDVFQTYRQLRRRYLVDQHSEHFFGLGRSHRKRELRKKFEVNLPNVMKHRHKLDSMADRVRSQSKIICLCEAWDHPLMWSHYASGHTGLVLVFAYRPEFVELTGEDAPLPICYSDERSHITTVDILAWLYASESNGALIDRSEHAFNAMILGKAADWEYEREWRIHKRSDKDGYKPVHCLELKEVLVGMRASRSREAEVREVCSGRVPVVRLRLDNKEYKLSR